MQIFPLENRLCHVCRFSIICFVHTFKDILRNLSYCILQSHLNDLLWSLLELQNYLDIIISYNFTTIPNYQAGEQR